MMTMPSFRTLPVPQQPLAALAMLAALLATAPASYGQSAPAPQAAPQVAPGPPITAQTAAGDPPARVGRLAQMNGTVSFHTADADQWSPASLNYPVTSGNALWTEPGARAMLQIGSGSRLVMDGGTELDIATLDDSTLAASVPQGSVYLQVDNLAKGERYSIHTPRGDLDVTAPGRYVVAAGDDDHATTATVLDGAASIGDHAVPAGRTASLSGPLDSADPAQMTLVAARPDPFTQSVLAAEGRPAPTLSTAAPPPAAVLPQQVSGMTGAQDLAAVGTWSTAPDYGSVWYPPVSAGWVPYRDGHWAWIAPWGWTWVADEPWGFAPFHYGRWVVIHDRWAWSPGIHVDIRYGRPRPVYAPALVVFFGGGASIGVLTEDVGWVPLGWHEAYYPPYRVSRTYIRNVNITHVTNITRITNVSTVNRVTIDRYHNIASATVVNRAVMQQARPVQHSVTHVSLHQYANLHANRQPAVRPVAAPVDHAVAPGPRIAPRIQSRGDVTRPPDQHREQSGASLHQPPRPQAHLPQSKPQAPAAADIARQQEARRQQAQHMQQQQAERRQDEQRAMQAQENRHHQEMQAEQHDAASRRQSNEQLARAQEQRREQDIRLRQQRDTMQHQEQQRQDQQRRAQQLQQDNQHRSRQPHDKDRATDPPGRQ